MTGYVQEIGTAIMDFAPRLLGAVVVLLATLIAAFLLQRLAARLLESAGLDALFERTGASESLWRLGYDGGPSRLLGTVIFWGILLTGLASTLSVLGLSSLQDTMSQVSILSGKVLVALAIMIGGTMFAGWLSSLVANEAERAGLRGQNVFRRIVFITIVTIAGLISASQLGIETSMLVLLAIVLLATIGLATALTLGQGLAQLSGNIAAGRYVQDGTEIGDVLSVNGVEGTVEELGYASISLRSEDGYLYRIPNRTLLETIVRKQA
ncbi:MAG: mechanosensitive ion channel family protein [Rubrobacteraceae bacterium]